MMSTELRKYFFLEKKKKVQTSASKESKHLIIWIHRVWDYFFFQDY